MTIASDRDLIVFHEGCTLVAIPDTRGFSIGYGHDGAIDGQTCTQEQADAWLDADLQLARTRAANDVGVSTWALLDPVRRAALTDMAYEIGGAGLAEFHDMIAGIKTRDWNEAHYQALNSKWAKQVPQRAEMDARMLLTGEWPVIA